MIKKGDFEVRLSLLHQDFYFTMLFNFKTLTLRYGVIPIHHVTDEIFVECHIPRLVCLWATNDTAR